MMNLVRYFSFPGEEKDYPVCGITTSLAGPMKNEADDENRKRVFRTLGIPSRFVISVRQTHSLIVRIAATGETLVENSGGDGVLVRNTDLIPCVYVADCMPIYLFDPVTLCFGVLHSGWRGTGIIRSAVDLASDEWGALPENFKVVLGPHIRSCCYTVDAERSEYFTRSFGASCVSLDPARSANKDPWPYRLSLSEANRVLCISLGIRPENIFDTGECTSCNTEFGSSRRQGQSSFTRMAAFVRRH